MNMQHQREENVLNQKQGKEHKTGKEEIPRFRNREREAKQEKELKHQIQKWRKEHRTGDK